MAKESDPSESDRSRPLWADSGFTQDVLTSQS